MVIFQIHHVYRKIYQWEHRLMFNKGVQNHVAFRTLGVRLVSPFKKKRRNTVINSLTFLVLF